ncbi:coiled-coil domain-containing protein 152 [Protopterus annectens]|uniref:coiled-coil domain-containing protein 152 n=1 Tax=Protopterus annectens TaxID=7888 RepID=UPI001CFA527E|nr:coiled-coil domain-containing protein 152 [Protopterus annectens]
MQGKNNLLEIHLEDANRMLKLGRAREDYMKEECTSFQSMIKSLQETIQSQCDIRDENERLKTAICDLEEKMKMLEKDYNSQIERLIVEKKNMEQEHKVKVAEVQDNMNRKFEVKEAEMNGILEKKEEEILELTKRQKIQEREKQHEIIKLQMEFNAKLARIQSTSVKSHQDNAALPQNIFKRKLQHLQEEKSCEIASLRQTIKELEQQVNRGHNSCLKRRRF